MTVAADHKSIEGSAKLDRLFNNLTKASLECRRWDFDSTLVSYKLNKAEFLSNLSELKAYVLELSKKTECELKTADNKVDWLEDDDIYSLFLVHNTLVWYFLELIYQYELLMIRKNNKNAIIEIIKAVPTYNIAIYNYISSLLSEIKTNGLKATLINTHVVLSLNTLDDVSLINKLLKELIETYLSICTNRGYYETKRTIWEHKEDTNYESVLRNSEAEIILAVKCLNTLLWHKKTEISSKLFGKLYENLTNLLKINIVNNHLISALTVLFVNVAVRGFGNGADGTKNALLHLVNLKSIEASSSPLDDNVIQTPQNLTNTNHAYLIRGVLYYTLSTAGDEGAFKFSQVVLACYSRLEQYLIDNANNNNFVLNYALMQAIQVYILFLPSNRCPQSTANTQNRGSYIRTLYDLSTILVNYLGNEVKSISQLAFMVYKKVISGLANYDSHNFYKTANDTLEKSLTAAKALSNKAKYTVCNVMIKTVDLKTILRCESYLLLHLLLNITNSNSVISALLLALLEKIRDHFGSCLNTKRDFHRYGPNPHHLDKVVTSETEKEGPWVMLKCYVYPLLTCVINEYRVENYEDNGGLLPVYRKSPGDPKPTSNEASGDVDKHMERELRFKYINEVMSQTIPNYYVDLISILNNNRFDFYRCLPTYYNRVLENKTLDLRYFFNCDLDCFYHAIVNDVRKYFINKISTRAYKGANTVVDERQVHQTAGDDDIIKKVSNGYFTIVNINNLSSHMIECLKNITKSHRLIHVNDLTIKRAKCTGIFILIGNSAYHIDLQNYLKRLYYTDDARLRMSLLEFVFHSNKVNKPVEPNEFAVFKYAMKYVIRLINASSTNSFIKIARLFMRRVAYNLNKQLSCELPPNDNGMARYLLVNTNATVQVLLSNLNLHYNEYRVELSLEVILLILEEFDSYNLLDSEYLAGAHGSVLFKLLDVDVFLKLNNPAYLYHNKKHHTLLYKITKLITLDRILRVNSDVIDNYETKEAISRIKTIPPPSLAEIKKPEYEFLSSVYLNAVDRGHSLHGIFADFYPKLLKLKRPAQQDLAKIPFYTLVVCYIDYDACYKNEPLTTSGFLNFSHKLFTYFYGSQNKWLNDIPKEGRYEIDKMTYKLYKLLLNMLLLIAEYTLDKAYSVTVSKYSETDRKVLNDYVMYNIIGELTKNITIIVSILVENGFKRMQKALSTMVFVLIYCILNCKVVHSNEIINNLLVVTLSYIKDTSTLHNYLLYLVSIVLNSGNESHEEVAERAPTKIHDLRGASPKDVFRLNLNNVNLAINNRCEHISLMFISVLKSLSSNKILYNYYVNDTISMLVVALLKYYYKDYLYCGLAKDQKLINETSTKVVVIAYVLRYIYRCVNIKFINNSNILNTMKITLLLLGGDVDFVTKNALTLLFSTVVAHNCNYFIYNYLNFTNFFSGSKLLLRCFCYIVRQHGQYLDKRIIYMATNPALENNVYTKPSVSEILQNAYFGSYEDKHDVNGTNAFLTLITELSNPKLSKTGIQSIDVEKIKNMFVFKYYIAKLYTLKYDNASLIKILSNLVNFKSRGNIYTIIHIIKHINSTTQSHKVQQGAKSQDDKNDEHIEKVIHLLCKLIMMYNRRGDFTILIILTELYFKIVNDNLKTKYFDAKFCTITQFCLRNDFVSSHTLHFELYRSLFYYFNNAFSVDRDGNQAFEPNQTILEAFNELSKTMIAGIYDLKYSLRENLSKLYLRELTKVNIKHQTAMSSAGNCVTLSDAFSHTYTIIMHLLTDDALPIRNNIAKLVDILDCKLSSRLGTDALPESVNSTVPICHDLNFGREVRNELYNGFTPHEPEYKLLKFIANVVPLRSAVSIFEHIVSFQSCKRFGFNYPGASSNELFDTEESNIYKEHITYLKYGLIILIDDLIAEKNLVKTIGVSIKIADLLSDQYCWHSNLAPFAFAALYLRLFIVSYYRDEGSKISQRINEQYPNYLSPDSLESFHSDSTHLSSLKDLIVENKRMIPCVNGFVYLHGQISAETLKLDNDHLLVLKRILISM